MTTIVLSLHILGAVIWVGGMFAIYVCLRPALGALAQPAARPDRRGDRRQRPLVGLTSSQLLPARPSPPSDHPARLHPQGGRRRP